MFLRNGVIEADTGFMHDDISYPPGWLAQADAEERARLGVIEVESPPSPRHQWRDGAWQIDVADAAANLADRRAALMATINSERDRREEASFPYRGKTLDSTPRSVQRITAAALAAQAALAMGQPFAIDWTCADNSTLSLDAAGVIGMPVALAQHAAALHGHARHLKAAVEAAMDGIALAEIDIQAGWPGSSQP